MSSDSASAIESEFRPGQVFAERYKILKQLAPGTVTTTYRVDDLATNRPVALKVVRASVFARQPDVMTAYRLDLNAMRQITHENIVRIFEFGEYAGYLYVAMEMLEGSTLADHLKRAGKLPAAEFFQLFCPLCDALAQLHSRKVIHRDVHPGNIFVTSGGSVKLMDFGIERDLRHTSKAAIAHGLEYAAPEQMAGRPAAASADIYSLGAVCYTMLTGKRPEPAARIPAQNHWTSLESLRKELRGMTPGLAGFLEVSLRHDPGKRYKNVNAMLASGCAVRDSNAAQPSRVKLANLMQDTPRSPDYCVRLLVKIIARLREMHVAGVAHAELSPQKIWIENDEVEIERAQTVSSQATMLIPDARYSAPELLMAQTALDESSHAVADIYVLGFVLYEFLAGRIKMDEQFGSNSPVGSALGWMRWHVDFDQRLQPLLKVLPDCPDALANLVNRMVEKDPSKRVRTLEEVEAKLSGLRTRLDQTDQIAAGAPGVAPSTQPKKSRRRFAVALTTLLVAAVLAGGGWWLARGGWKTASSTVLAHWRAFRGKKPSELMAVAKVESGYVPTSPLQPVIETPTGLMLLIPAGAFTMGDDGTPNESPSHQVTLPAFYIDRVEVSNVAYREFCRRSGRPLPPSPAWDSAYFSKDQYPAVNVTWENANAFCEASGKRLPTEAEWEKAARGTEPFIRWANWTMPGVANLAGSGPRRPAPVGSHPGDVSPFGVLDLAGNVQEWVSDSYRPYGNAAAATGAEDGRKLIRGGSFNTTPGELSPAWRGWVAEGPGPAESPSVGFRCASNIPK